MEVIDVYTKKMNQKPRCTHSPAHCSRPALAKATCRMARSSTMTKGAIVFEMSVRWKASTFLKMHSKGTRLPMRRSAKESQLKRFTYTNGSFKLRASPSARMTWNSEMRIAGLQQLGAASQGIAQSVRNQRRCRCRGEGERHTHDCAYRLALRPSPQMHGQLIWLCLKRALSASSLVADSLFELVIDPLHLLYPP